MLVGIGHITYVNRHTCNYCVYIYIQHDTVPEFHAEAPHATASEGLPQDSHVAARAVVEATTLRTKDVDSTNASPRSTMDSRVHCALAQRSLEHGTTRHSVC